MLSSLRAASLLCAHLPYPTAWTCPSPHLSQPGPPICLYIRIPGKLINEILDWPGLWMLRQLGQRALSCSPPTLPQGMAPSQAALRGPSLVGHRLQNHV